MLIDYMTGQLADYQTGPKTAFHTSRMTHVFLLKSRVPAILTRVLSNSFSYLVFILQTNQLDHEKGRTTEASTKLH